VFPDRFDTDKPAKAENILLRESKTANLNCHGISIQGLLKLESRKSEQRPNPFDLDFVCLDQIEGSSWLQIFTCVIQCRQI
jgi:hypothetical protein